MKLCKDCAHFSPSPTAGTFIAPRPLLRCKSPQSNPIQDSVYGHWCYHDARTMRADVLACGKDAKWFEPKNVTPLVPLMPLMPVDELAGRPWWKKRSWACSSASLAAH